MRRDPRDYVDDILDSQGTKLIFDDNIATDGERSGESGN